MWRLTHFLLIVAVIVCGLHLSGPESAAASALEASAHVDAGSGSEGCDRDDDGSQHLTHSHHHCPIAPDQRGALEAPGTVTRSGALLPALATVLASRSQAPPIQPPTA